MAFEDLGEQLVKNIAHPIRAFRLRIGEAVSEQEVPIPEEMAETPEPPSAPAAISELSADNEVALELALWDSVKDGSPAELESYLERIRKAPLPRSPEHGLMPPRSRPPAERRRRPRKSAAEALDLAFWNSVKDSNRREELQAYLEQHPNGHFADSPGRAFLRSTSLSVRRRSRRLSVKRLL